MRMTAILVLCCALVACKRESAEEPVGEIRGQPIVATVNTNAAQPLPKPPATQRLSTSEEVDVAQSKVVALPTATNSATTIRKIGEYQVVGFDKLAAYNFEVSDDLLAPSTNSAALAQRVDSQIPATVKAFNEKPVALTGFMLPLKVEGGLVTELLIMRDQSMCCYGVQPKINEWVSVKMSRAGVKPIMDQPVTLFGKLRVGEMRENGYLVGIYAMDGHKMEAPE
jgi:hypothetical protein